LLKFQAENITYRELRTELAEIINRDALLAIIEKCASKILLHLQGHAVVLTWSESISKETVDKILKSVPFQNWQEDINRITNPNVQKPDLYVEKIHIQNVDMFGQRVGFSKFQVIAKKWNERESKVASVPGIVFMRGGAVGILCILKENKEDGREFSLVTLQPRVPAACAEFCEIPAGMLDEARQRFAGKAADEMREETGLEIKDTDLIDLTEMAYGNLFRGMYPSAGGCDEFIRLFLYRRYVSPEVLEALHNAFGGDGDSEIIKLKIVPLEDLWLHAPDAKALSALYLYQKYLEKIHKKQSSL